MLKVAVRFLVCCSLIFVFPQTLPAAAVESAPPFAALTTGTVLHVTENANGSGCASWEDACPLPTALSASIAGDQIWVAEGTYKPGDTYYALPNGVAVYGGFNGDETSLDQRDWAANPTMLSGEIGDPDSLTDNSGLIVAASYTDATTLLDGFTIRDGYSNDWGSGLYAYSSQATFANLTFINHKGNQGGAITFIYGSPKLQNCTISDSTATWGGGLYLQYSSPVLTDVTFEHNNALESGGGLEADLSSNPILTRVVFKANSAAKKGGGMSNMSGNPVLTDVTFLNNQTLQFDTTVFNGGGGMYNYFSYSSGSCAPILTNVMFQDNVSADDGGGMYNLRLVNATLTNVTFSGNSAVRGGGYSSSIASTAVLTNTTFAENTATSTGGGIYLDSITVNAFNSILWGNTPTQMASASSTVSLDYSIIEGGCPTGAASSITCPNLLTPNPLLLDAADNGGFTPTLALPAGSPAIDSGSPRVCPAKDQRGYFRPINGDGTPGARCDIGAYEYDSFLLSGPVLYAAPDAAGYCSGWGDACNLQTALDHAEPEYQIWVREGVHKPTYPSNTSDNRTSAFVLKPGVAVYGGFNGSESSLEERDWIHHQTSLDGNIGTLAVDDNSYHVVVTSGLDASTVLDGFTILGGKANGSATADKNGGGIINSGGSPTFRNLILYKNNAENYGGGLYNTNVSSPMLEDVTFSTNTALLGGGMYNFQSASTLLRVKFTNNRASGTGAMGGGLYNDDGSVSLKDVIFSDNEAVLYGGGICNIHTGELVLDQTLFDHNISTYYGGGIYNGDYSTAEITNATFVGNSSDLGGGVYTDNYGQNTLLNVTMVNNSAKTAGGAIQNHYYGASNLINSILWGNTPNQIFNDLFGSAAASYSDIDQTGFSGSGNIRLDPRLIGLANNGGFSQTMALKFDSPAIDSGDPLNCPDVDQRGYPRPLDGNGDSSPLCDMGAFEYGTALKYYLPILLR